MNKIDSFINEKIQPEYRDIFIAFRKLISDQYPDIREEMRGGTEKYYGVPVYKLNKTLVTVSPTKNGITFNFSEGAKFKDKYNKLEGLGNKTLNLRLKTLDAYNVDEMKYYMDQAINLDSE